MKHVRYNVYKKPDGTISDNSFFFVIVLSGYKVVGEIKLIQV